MEKNHEKEVPSPKSMFSSKELRARDPSDDVSFMSFIKIDTVTKTTTALFGGFPLHPGTRCLDDTNE